VTPSLSPESLEALRTSDLFGRLEAASRDHFQNILTEVRLHRGDTLLRSGDPGERLYLVVSGRLGVTAEEEEGSTKKLSEVGPGEVVGEIAILTESVRTATVRAWEETTVVAFSRAALEWLEEEDPEAGERLRRLAETRP
jgi:CRP-like cAMP-binding protein